MIALPSAPNLSYIKKKRHIDPNDPKEFKGSIILRAVIRNCELIGHFPFKTYLDISLRWVSIFAIGHFSSFLRIWYQWKGLKINFLISLFNFPCTLQSCHPMVRHFRKDSCAAKSYGCNISPDVDEEDKEQGWNAWLKTDCYFLEVTSHRFYGKTAFLEKPQPTLRYLIGWTCDKNTLWWRLCRLCACVWTTPLELSFLSFFRSMFWMKESLAVVLAIF